MALLIENCRLVLNGNDVFRNILVKDGKISRIFPASKSKTPKISHNIEKTDAKNNYVIPGIIDPHVHFREPGMTHKEDLFTGSVSAAAGGITTFLDMPNTNPPATTIEILNEKKSLAAKSVVNYGFHFGAAVDNLKEIKKAGGKAASTKLFMNLSTGKMMIEDKSLIGKIFKASKIVSVHAEGSKVNEAVGYAKKAKTRLYLCHISQKSELGFIKKEKKKAKGMIFAEATPHHLFLTENDFKNQKGFAAMKPSLKKQEDVEALWKAIDEGVIDAIGTDHAPHTKEEKRKKDYPSGVPGCETALPLMLDAVNRGKISLTKVVRLMSSNPAKIFRIKNKGKIKKGYDADLVIIDMERKRKVDSKNLFTKCKWSPFSGKILKGWPIMTIVGGKIVFDDTGFYDIKAKEVVFDV
jgi:dihydroorotase